MSDSLGDAAANCSLYLREMRSSIRPKTSRDTSGAGH